MRCIRWFALPFALLAAMTAWPSWADDASSSPKSLRAAAVQMRSSRDLADNISRIKDHLLRCAADGVRVVVFPECALTGYFDNEHMRQFTAEQLADAERQIGDACREAKVYAVIGSPVRAGEKLYNSALVINPHGRVIERYHKLQLAESWPDGGDHLSVFPIDGVPCTIIVCHDERYPELVRLPVLAGARVVFYVSHESGVRQERKIEPYRAQIQARAVENGVFVVHANAPANDDLSGSHGHSRIIRPDGNLAGEASMFDEETVTATLDLSLATAGNALNSIRRGTLGDWWRKGIEQVRMIEDPDARIDAALRCPLLGPDQTLHELLDHAESRVPQVPTFSDANVWGEYADRLRGDLLEQIVFRGQAAGWRDAPARMEWLETIEGGPGYRIRKLRYEALPGLWIPALLYEPTELNGHVPAVLNVNGHDRKGKSAEYKQARCINQVKRGMLALNVEWLGMGQLATEGYQHDRLGQIDLCGASGVAPFYLCLKRGLDVLLAHEHVDPERVAVTGLSGGGWQTIFISSLDTRVKLANPVAGYGSLRTNMRSGSLGDAEQSPCDFGTLADYSHLTTLMAPRPLLLTYNVKDDCCFQSGDTLPTLLAAGQPVYKLLGHADRLRAHVNHDPGTHNYESDNRQAMYRMLGDHFFAGDSTFDAREKEYAGEVKSAEALMVELPQGNHDLHTLAMSLAGALPQRNPLPTDAASVPAWRRTSLDRLRDCVRFQEFQASIQREEAEEVGGVRVVRCRARIGAWTVPYIEFTPAAPRDTAMVVVDDGRAGAADEVRRLLEANSRVLAVDPLFIGESRVVVSQPPQYVTSHLLSCLGERPLGIQASQLAALANQAQAEYGAPVRLAARGPHSCTAALVAAALAEECIAAVELDGPLGTLRELLEADVSARDEHTLLCFGLLGAADIGQLAALTAPRPVTIRNPSDRARAELNGLGDWYGLLGVQHEPLP